MSLARYSDICDILEKILEDSETNNIAKIRHEIRTNSKEKRI